VQGVFFRRSLQEQADRLGVGGWTRNLDDGSVEAEIEGERVAVERAIAWARRGPPGAWVEDVEIHWISASGRSESFEVR
jgi:acylphosphatase